MRGGIRRGGSLHVVYTPALLVAVAMLKTDRNVVGPLDRDHIATTGTCVNRDYCRPSVTIKYFVVFIGIIGG